MYVYKIGCLLARLALYFVYKMNVLSLAHTHTHTGMKNRGKPKSVEKFFAKK